ncbi:hypothetical protein DXG03_000930 [Asterophora parasitica]|uniref:Uncharacterized protein n=1 Tax=Asterophora parasitica TaxID=117018 RepID=A0A9P7FZG0_9AGAR|nr:hypothetical protein DXG03_000930 [Asterophora parasitica]
MATKTMPGRNSHNAPVFDRKAVQELGRYFSNLELLFADCGIMDEAEKKAYSYCYLNIDDHTLWKSIDGYTTNSYDDWKAKIFELHPGSEENAQFNQTDLDLLLTTIRATRICLLEHGSSIPAANNLAQRLAQIHAELRAELEHAQQLQAWYYDQHREHAPTLKEGQLV